MKTHTLGHATLFFILFVITGCEQVTHTVERHSDAGDHSDAEPLDADLRDASEADAALPDSGAAIDAELSEDGGLPFDINWVRLPEGSFMMGSDAHPSSQPIHVVTLAPFELSRTEVTVEQYLACQQAGGCRPTREVQRGPGCNSAHADRGDHPMDCVNRDDALAFCAWVGGRLPTEAEWEYAARSAGQYTRYPWGEQSADCRYAIMAVPNEDGGSGLRTDGCGTGQTWPVCSRPEGNTIQGLCDMAGNVEEWVHDPLCDYTATPLDGSSAECESEHYVYRGGHWGSDATSTLATHRGASTTNDADFFPGRGFRVVRSRPQNRHTAF